MNEGRGGHMKIYIYRFDDKLSSLNPMIDRDIWDNSAEDYKEEGGEDGKDMRTRGNKDALNCCYFVFSWLFRDSMKI